MFCIHFLCLHKRFIFIDKQRKFPFRYFPLVFKLCKNFTFKISALYFPISNSYMGWGWGIVLAQTTTNNNSVPKHFSQCSWLLLLSEQQQQQDLIGGVHTSILHLLSCSKNGWCICSIYLSELIVFLKKISPFLLSVFRLHQTPVL